MTASTKQFPLYLQRSIATNRARGIATKEAIYNTINDSSVPLTINEITALSSTILNKSVSREYVRSLAVTLLASKRISVRVETLSERAARKAGKGPDQNVYSTSRNHNATRYTAVPVPFKVTSYNKSRAKYSKKKNKVKAKAFKAPASTSASLDALLKDIVDSSRGLHNKVARLEATIVKLEAKLAKVRAVVNK